jgi:hypothetical protein
MSKPKTYRTPGGRTLTDADLDAIADEVERKDYDAEELKTRRRGRPLMGSGPADVVPVRLEPELKRAVDERAEAEHLSASELIRRALRKYLDVA